MISYSVSGERSAVKYRDNQCQLTAVFNMEDSLGVSTAFLSSPLTFGIARRFAHSGLFRSIETHVGTKQSQCLGPFPQTLPAVRQWSGKLERLDAWRPSHSTLHAGVFVWLIGAHHRAGS